MPDWIRRRLSYANVMSTVAVFIALGGSSYAALTITGRDIRDGSLSGKDLKRNSVGGKTIKESRLGLVPRARHANRVGGLSAARLKQRCPPATVHSTGACVELSARPAAPYSLAIDICQSDAFKGFGEGSGRLPSLGELYRTMNRGGTPSLTPPGELTQEIVDVRPDGTVLVLVMTTPTGRSAVVPDTAAEGARPYRCAMDPANNEVTDP